ncbi:MAG: LysM peptidoglycan-binding domain-containing protein [Bacilli bacterium]
MKNVSGDTLYNVSKTFGINQEDLVRQNKTIYLLPEQMIFYKRD